MSQTMMANVAASGNSNSFSVKTMPRLVPKANRGTNNALRDNGAKITIAEEDSIKGHAKRIEEMIVIGQ